MTSRYLWSRAAFAFALFTGFAASPAHAKDAALAGIDAIYPELDAFYLDLHQNPELSGHEEKTAAKLAVRLRRLAHARSYLVAETPQPIRKLRGGLLLVTRELGILVEIEIKSVELRIDPVDSR